MTTDTSRDRSFGAALRSRWQSLGHRRQLRMLGGMIAVGLLVPVHVYLYVATGNLASLVAAPVLPVGGYLTLRGWAYQSPLVLGLGISLAAVAAAAPFYLAAG